MAQNVPTNQAEDVAKTLTQTDFGSFINQNKNNILIGAVVVLIAIAAYAFYDHSKQVQIEEKLSSLYNYHQDNINPIFEKKVESLKDNDQAKDSDIKLSEQEQKQVVSLYNQAPREFFSQINFLSLFMRDLNYIKVSSLNKDVIAVLELFDTSLASSSNGQLFLKLKLASYYEDESQFKLASEALEKLIAMDNEILNDKVYFDLARLYLTMGNKEQAKKNFDYVISQFPESSYKKMAQLFLLEI